MVLVVDEPRGRDGEQRRSIAALILALSPGLVLGMTVTLVMPVLPMLAAHWGGGSRGQLLAQYFIAMTGVGITVGAPISGYLIDKTSLRLVLIGSVLLYVGGGASAIFFDAPEPLLLSRFIAGLGAGGFASAASALVAQYWHGVARTRLLGYVSVVGAAAAVCTIMLAGAMAQHYGWHAPFLLFGLALPLALFGAAISDTPREPAAARASSASSRWRPLLPIFALSLPLYVAMFVPTTQFPLLLPEIGLTEASERSSVLAAATIFTALAGFAFSRLYHALRPAGMTLLIFALYGLGMVAMGFMHDPVVAVIASMTCGAATGLLPAHFQHLVLDECSPAIRGRAVAVLVAVHYSAQFLNPVVLGTLGTMIGLRMTVAGAGTAFFIWALSSVPAARNARRAAASAAE